jgi:hypothetical protein
MLAAAVALDAAAIDESLGVRIPGPHGSSLSWLMHQSYRSSLPRRCHAIAATRPNLA